MDFSIILEELKCQLEEYKSNRFFKIKPTSYNGVVYTTIGTDDDILRLLRYKGTGKQVLFNDLKREYVKYMDNWWEGKWEGLNNGNLVPIDIFAESRKYEIIYKKDDIIITQSKNQVDINQ